MSDMKHVVCNVCNSNKLAQLKTMKGRTLFIASSYDPEKNGIMMDDPISFQIIVCTECGNYMTFSPHTKFHLPDLNMIDKS